MTWFAIHDANGKLLSAGTVIAPNLPADWVVKEYPTKPPDTDMWDEASRNYIVRPPKVLIDRLQDILDHPAYADIANFYSNLNPANKTRFRNFLIKILGARRWRNQAETISLDGSPD